MRIFWTQGCAECGAGSFAVRDCEFDRDGGGREFIVGNNGNFDVLVQEVLKEITEEKPYVSCAVMLSRIDERALCGDQRMTVFPEGLERTPPRFAIARRNELMLKNASHVIAYVKHTPSDSVRWVQRAEGKGLRVINLAR